MSLYDKFETDPQSEKDGVWLDYGDFRVRISRAGGANKDYQKKLDRLTRPHRRAIATDSLDPAVSRTLLRRAYASAVIKDWESKDKDGNLVKGIEQKDGSIAPATNEAIEKVLLDLDAIFMDIKAQAESIELFRAALREEAAEN